ncbi:MAG: recombinase family protein [Coprococcus sp.]
MKIFSVPADFNEKTIDAYNELNQKYAEAYVGETYGQVTKDYMHASQVVKRIFSMYLKGMKFAEIARTLKNEGILSPSQYRYANIGDKEKLDKAKDWYYVRVKDILKDQQYVGDSVHGKLGGKLGEHRTKRRNNKEDCPKWRGLTWSLFVRL